MEQDRLWGLLGDLSRQLNANVNQVELLKRQAEELKTQAIHNSSGFTLRRFNVDISKEQFDSELERLNATLVLENHALQHENKQLSMLLKDYEGTLENVMGRFRAYAYSTQMHELNISRHYESLLQQQQQQHAAIEPVAGPSRPSPGSTTAPTDLATFQDPIEMQASLFRMAQLLRKALRASQGEDPSPPDSPTFLEPPAITSSDHHDQQHSQEAVISGHRDQEQSKALQEHSANTNFGIPPPPTATELHARLGGYLALLSRKDPASQGKGHDVVLDDSMRRDIELEQLRQENESLRGLLEISRTGGGAESVVSASEVKDVKGDKGQVVAAAEQ